MTGDKVSLRGTSLIIEVGAITGLTGLNSVITTDRAGWWLSGSDCPVKINTLQTVGGRESGFVFKGGAVEAGRGGESLTFGDRAPSGTVVSGKSEGGST